MNPWEPRNIEGGQCLEWAVGPLSLRVRRTEDEWLVAAARSGEVGDKAAAAAPGKEAYECGESVRSEWVRWAAGAESGTAQLVPTMPDRPLVVRPETPVKIPPEHQALFYVSIPVWVRVTVGEGQQLALCEEPTVRLSNIWFGDPLSGELCYSLHTRARRSVAPTDSQPHRAVCPVKISNRASTALDMQRLSVHVEHLKVYAGESQLRTNEVSVSFTGSDQLSEITYSDTAPDVEHIGAVLCGPRKPLKKRQVIRRTFGKFPSFLGFAKG